MPYIVTQTFESLSAEQSDRIIRGIEIQIEHVKLAIVVTLKTSPIYPVLQNELQLLLHTYRKLAGREYREVD